MAEIKVELRNTGITKKSIMEYKKEVEKIHADLHSRADDENDFVGWLNLPSEYDKNEFKR